VSPAAPDRDRPVVIEAAINGANPEAPRTPDEITRCALACFEAGAAVVHNHVDRFGSADAAAARYREGWDPVLAVRPDALLYPTINGIGPVEERYSHITPLAEHGGLRIGVIDPGSVNLGASFAYVNSGADIEHQWKLCDAHGLVPGMSIFEPGFLRAALSYWHAGRLPPGTMLRFYFGGREAEAHGGFTFGLAPSTRTSSCSATVRCRGRSPSSAVTSSPPICPGSRSHAAAICGSGSRTTAGAR
jgi:3-keto-5-aminohexanoate cleavage enzyme